MPILQAPGLMIPGQFGPIIPTQDMIAVYRFMQEKDGWMIGPNCPGPITPGACKVGILPGHRFKEGTVGVVPRSRTWTD